MWVVIAALLAPASYGQDYHGFAVEDYRQDGACCDDNSCSNLSYTINQAQAFEGIVEGWQASGLWTASTVYEDLGADAADWTDSARETWGADSATHGADAADVAYFSGHGDSDCPVGESWGRSQILVGEAQTGQDCLVDSDSGAGDGHWYWGNGAIKIALLDTCQSMEKCVWDRNGYSDVDGYGTALTMIGGFHGNSYDLAGQVGALEDYVSTSRLSGVGDHWLDERAIWYPFANLDQCPTVLIWGQSATHTDTFYSSGGLDDWVSTGTHSMTTFYFLVGCDPAEGEELH